jgi:hypothetical protein
MSRSLLTSRRRHTLLDLGKLGGVTNGLAEARDSFARLGFSPTEGPVRPRASDGGVAEGK